MGTKDKKTHGRRGYPAEVKQKVLAQLAGGDKSLREASKHFNISMPTLIKWRKERVTREGAAQSGSLSSDGTELERLRAEVERLREERDRLRRGIAILAGVEVSE